jgi:two-component system, OmpR family, sensor histidine kinase KdpD
MQQLMASTGTKSANVWDSYVQAVCVVAVLTFLNIILYPHVVPVNLILIYLCGIVFSAKLGRGPSIVAVILSIAVFGLFFAPGSFSLITNELQYLLTAGLVLVVALIVSSMTNTTKMQAETVQQRQQITAALYELSSEFANSDGTQAIIDTASQFLQEAFEIRALILLPDQDDRLVVPSNHNIPVLTLHETGVAQWVYDQGKQAGCGTETLPGSSGLYLPLATARGIVGILGIFREQPGLDFPPEHRQLLLALASQIGLAIERNRLAEETEQIKLNAEVDQLRNVLLRSIAHDLRTPLASVTGPVSSLVDGAAILTEDDKRELAQIAYEAANHLNRIIGNLLDMTKLETGEIQVKKEWIPLEEVVASALTHFAPELIDHPVTLILPSNMPFLRFDEALIERVLRQLLQNAIQYTPSRTPIYLSARYVRSEVIIEVADEGPGLAPGDEGRVFEKFLRAHPETGGGIGLGLAICRAIVEAHGGRIWAENRSEKGAAFYFTLPVEAQLPQIDFGTEEIQSILALDNPV